MKQDEFNAVLNVLKNTVQKNQNIYKKINHLDNVKKFYSGRYMIINAFKDKIFSLYHKSRFEWRYKFLINYKKLDRLNFLKERDINGELVRKRFLVQNLRSLLKNLEKAKDNTENNNIQVNLIIIGLNDLKNEIKEMSEDKKKKLNIPMKQWLLLKRFLSLIIKIKKEKG